ncbi:MAG: hypothetical protein FWE44_08045 [Defluviitaleaceae bacterium]|nr:hypothetical protein [Defluviitaleaceae bacterium]
MIIANADALQPIFIGVAIIGGIMFLAYIIYAVSRASSAKSNSEINITADYVNGRGYVGAIGKSVFDMDHGVKTSNFHLNYSQITGVNADGEWLTIIASSSQYMLKVSSAISLAQQIQNNKINKG